MATFPYTDMPTIVEARFDGLTWTDLSDRLTDDPINTREGRSPGAQRSPVSSAGLVLDNDDGDLTPLNPMSSRFPDIQLGLGMRIRQRWFLDTFTRTISNSLGTSDTGQTYTNVGGTVPDDYDVNGTAATHTMTSAAAPRTSLTTPAVATGDTSFTFSWSALATGADVSEWLVIGSDVSNYYAARLNLSPAGQVFLSLVKAVGGSGGTVVASQLVGTYSANSHWSARIQRAAGNAVLAKSWPGELDTEPDDWTAVGSDGSLSDFTKIGWFSLRETGNTNVNPVASVHVLQGNHDVYQGEAGAWDPDFIPTTDGAGEELSVVRIQLAGIGQRLTKNPKVFRSPLFRTMAGVAPGDYVPHAYWPMEDGTDATSFASGIAAGSPLAIPVGATPAAVDGPAGSETLATLDAGATLPFTVPSYSSTQIAFQWFMRIPSEPAAEMALAEFYAASGPVRRWRVTIVPGSPAALWLRDYDASGTEINATGVSLAGASATNPSEADVFGNWVALLFAPQQIGANVHSWLGIAAGPPGGAPGIGNVDAGTLGTVTSGVLYGGESGCGIGHMGIYTDTAFDLGFSGVAPKSNVAAMNGYDRELADVRAARVARETEVPMTVVGTSTAAMGPQPIGTMFDILGECEDVAQAVFGEAGSGLGFTCPAARYNVPSTVTVDLSTYRTDATAFRQVLSPRFNDQGLITAATAQRINGGEATVDSGVSPAYVEEQAYNAAGDDQLPHIAAWRVHMGQRIAMRYPGTPLNLGENATLIPGWMLATRQLGLGRITRTNVPTKHGYVDIDEMVDGWTQTLKRRSWTVTYDGTPAALLTAAEYDDTAARYSSRSTTTAEALDTTETGIDIVTTTGKPPWITGSTAPQFPHDIVIGGERIRITVSTSTGTYTRTLTVQRSINGVVKSHDSGAPVALYQPAIWAY